MSDRVSDIRRSLQVSHAENPTSSMHAFLSRQHAKPLPQIVGTQPLGEIPSTSSACPAIKSIRLRHKAKERLPSIAPAAVPSAAKSNSHQRTPSKTRDRTRGVTVGTGRRTLSRAAMERAGSVTTMRKIRGNKPKVSGLFERGDEDEAGYIDVEDDPFGEQVRASRTLRFSCEYPDVDRQPDADVCGLVYTDPGRSGHGIPPSRYASSTAPSK